VNALAMLKPGGVLGVVDFHYSTQHAAFTRAFWQRWFARDGVRLDPEHANAARTVAAIRARRSARGGAVLAARAGAVLHKP